jgi:hypothetical protein
MMNGLYFKVIDLARNAVKTSMMNVVYDMRPFVSLRRINAVVNLKAEKIKPTNLVDANISGKNKQKILFNIIPIIYRNFLIFVRVGA